MLRGAFCIWQRDLLVFRRNLLPEMVNVVAFPLTFFLTFALGLQGYISDIEGVPYATFVAPGLITMTATMAAFDDGAWGLWYHRVVQGTINEYRCTPITVYDIIIGKIISGFTLASFKGIVVGIVLLGMNDLTLSPGHLASYLVFIFLGSMIFSCVGSIFGTLIDKPENLGRLEGIIIMPLIFLAGLFFPLTAYPPEIRPWVEWIPTTALFVGSRSALLAGQVVRFDLLICTIFAIAGFAAAVILFERKVRR